MPDFLQQVRQAMEDYFGADARRIAHALQVTAYAEELLAFIEADPTVTLTAAYLHDIGIPEAERTYGSCAGPHQEELGPPVARELLTGLGAPEGLIETVCTMIGRHHTPGGLDSPEFRILWDADMLVNLEEIVPGKPLYFASATTLGGFASGILVESHMGRPTKIEGNPHHPASLGATTAFAQASVLGLYDPDRSQVVLQAGRISTWDAFLSALNTRLAAEQGRQGAGLRVLTEAVTSPTLASQLRQLLTKFPAATWHQYEPAGRDAARTGARLAFGEPVDLVGPSLNVDPAPRQVHVGVVAFPLSDVRHGVGEHQRVLEVLEAVFLFQVMLIHHAPSAA